MIHDNSDVPDRCEKIIRGSQISFFDKDRLWNMLSENKPDLCSTSCSLRGSGLGAAKPIMELLALTQDPYLGNQILKKIALDKLRTGWYIIDS